MGHCRRAAVQPDRPAAAGTGRAHLRDLFGFEAPARPAPAAPKRPPVTAAPVPAAEVRKAAPPVVEVAPAVLAVETPPFGQDLPPWQQPRRPMAGKAIKGCQDVENVTDSTTISLAHAFQGWQLSPSGNVYTGMTHHQAIVWAVAALEADGWLREQPAPGAQSRFILDVDPPVVCGLEVYQLLTQMLAAIRAGQVKAADPINDAGLERWARNAERVLHNHRAAALARKERHV